MSKKKIREKIEEISARVMAYVKYKGTPCAYDEREIPAVRNLYNHAAEDIAFLLNQLDTKESGDKKRTYLDEVKTFFDPHPGLAGATIPLPKAVLKVVEDLNGKSMTLRKATARIRQVTTGKVSTSKDHKHIFLEIVEPSSGIRHVFRVIRFR